MTHAIGSLFSGYGGLDLAVDMVVGAEPAWFVEFDDAPSKILNRHWPGVPNHGDVTKVDWSALPPVDIITGGSPCQDLSQAGRRQGMTEGTRSNLWVNMREAIATIRPKLVVWENVQGALSAKATSDSDMEPGEGQVGNGGGGHLRALGRVLGDLAEIGYDTRWTTVRASDVGAPHHRARVFLIATPTDPQSGRGVSINDSPWCPPACREGNGWTDGGYRSEVAAHPGRERHGEGLQSDHLGRVDRADEGQSQKWEWARQVSQYRGPAHVIDGLRPLPDPIGKRWNGRGAAPLEAEGPQPAANRHSSGIEWGEYAPAVRRWERLTRPAPDPTEPNTKGNPRLKAAFAEWMMGLPAGWVTDTPGISRADQLKAIGNGVCPPQAAAALLQLLEIMDEQEMVTSHDPR